MPAFLKSLLGWLKSEPAMVYVSVAVTVSSIFLQITHASPTVSAAVAAAVTAGGAALTAALAKPVAPAVLTGALAAFLTAISPYWLHLSASGVQGYAVAITTVLGLILRAHLTPAVNTIPAPVPAGLTVTTTPAPTAKTV